MIQPEIYIILLIQCTCTYGASWLILTYQFLNHWSTCTCRSNKNKLQILVLSIHWCYWNKESILYCIFANIDCFMIHIPIRQIYLNKTVDRGCDFFFSSLINQEVNTFYIKCLLTCFNVELMIHCTCIKALFMHILLHYTVLQQCIVEFY